MNFVLIDENAIYYEIKYSCDNALLLSLGSEKFFFTDGRYELEAKEAISNANIIITNNLYKEANTLLRGLNIKSIIYDPKEWNIYAFEILTKDLDIDFIQDLYFSHKRRIKKSSEEIALLKEASRRGREAFDRFAKEINSRGFGDSDFRLTHLAETILSNYGEYSLSFDPIVAINQNSAKPHAKPSNLTLKSGDLLLFDAGLKYKRYCSDRTRTASVDIGFDFKIQQKFKSKRMQRVYDTVLMAHDKAISNIEAGMSSKDVDKLARDVIEKAGFGKYFVHSTGHGVGLDIHEMPYISQRTNTILEDGMVFTIEPGIYLPNEFGVRIEDMVAIINGKATTL
jgi:Xaa-Pro aminopeptidase